MTDKIDIALRESALQSDSDMEAFQYRIEREIVPLLARIRAAVNSVIGEDDARFGDTISIDFSDSPYDVKVTDEFIRVTSTDGEVVVNLRGAADAITGVRLLNVKKLNTGGGNVVVTAATGEDIDDGATAPLTAQYESIRLVPRASGYDIF